MVDYEIYTVGWICALRAELVAAQELLDEELMDPVPTSKNDNNTYTLGKIGPHHVVIAGLPRGEYGETSAATAARDMVHTFPNVRIGFMVGIGGGVPTKYDVRLGDVVVGSPSYRSGGLIKYDHGRATQGGGTDLMGSLNQPPVSILTAITKLSAFHDRRGHNLNQAVDKVLTKNPRLVRLGYQRPPDDIDRLYDAGFIHPSRGEECSAVCPDMNLKQRRPRLESDDNPKIHYGLIASGSKLMEDSVARDHLAETEHVLCFEMEAAGLANHFPCVAIRGICDYSDSHRGRTWQGYAALVAAAYAKELLLQISPENIKQEETMKEILQGIEDVKTGLEPLAKTSQNVEYLNDERKRKDELKIIDWLNAVDYVSEQYDFLKPQQRQPGTGQQFLSSETFQTWLRTKNSFLFCSGMPGAGKTITTAITVEYLISKFRDDPTVGLAYVYCSYQKRDQQKAQDLFTSLLKQLTLHQSPLPKAIHELYKKNYNGRERPSFDDIVTTLQKVVNAFSTTFIVIDALDEHDSWDEFLSHIQILQDKTTANIFLTSRPKPTLPGKLQRCFMHDIQADDQDVGLYVDQRMKKMMLLGEGNKDLSDTVKEDYRKLIREKLSQAVNGIFLLARIYLDSLMDETNLNSIRTFLDNLPTGLRAYADAYEKTILRIRNQRMKRRDLARRALAWLTFSQEPFKKAQFLHAVSIQEGMSELKDGDFEITNIILDVCMGLVTIDEGSRTVRLLHFTTMEYLKANPNCLLSLEASDNPMFVDNPSDLEVERSVARRYYEMKLTTTCLTYLLFDEFKSGQCQYAVKPDFRRQVTHENSDLQDRLVKYPLYSYAARYWVHHAGEGEPCSKVLEFLNSESHVSASSQCIAAFRCGVDRIFYDKSVHLGRVTGLHLTAFLGLQTETVSLLNTRMETDVRDGWGRTPLSYASEEGHIDVASRLLDFQVDVESKSNWEDYNSPRTALSHAAKQGHAGIVRLLLTKGRATPDSMPSLGDGKFERTPLSFASEAGHQDVISILLGGQGVDPNYKDHLSRTPLHYAVQAGHNAIVGTFLATEGVELERKDWDGKSPLHYAAQAGHEAIVRLFIATKRVDPDLSDDNGMTPLSHAAKSGHEDVVKLLLAANKGHSDPLDGRDGSLFPLILKPLSDSEKCQPLADIIKTMIVSGGVYANCRDNKGRTPLFHAGLNGQESIVKLFLSRTDAEPNTQDSEGRTVLSHAACHDNGIVELLLSFKGIDPDLADENGRTPLSHAAESRHGSGFQLLLADDRVGADSKDTFGRTPLSYAAGRKDASKVKLLLDIPGVNRNTTDALGRTPFSYAVETGDLESCELFIEDVRVDADCPDNFGRTPLFYWAKRAEVLRKKLGSKRKSYSHLDLNAEDYQKRDEEELDQIRRLTRKLLAEKEVDIVSLDTDWRTPADMMPELKDFVKNPLLRQQGKKRKEISE